jgi:hypothetical protein
MAKEKAAASAIVATRPLGVRLSSRKTHSPSSRHTLVAAHTSSTTVVDEHGSFVKLSGPSELTGQTVVGICLSVLHSVGVENAGVIVDAGLVGLVASWVFCGAGVGSNAPPCQSNLRTMEQ